MFFDRNIAKSNFYNLVNQSYRGWISIVGNKGIGKSSFIKEVLGLNSDFFICEPIFELKYWKEFSNVIKNFSSEVLNDFFNKSNEYKERYLKKSFLGELNQDERNYIIEEIIKNEIINENTTFAKWCGEFISKKIKYIVLDNFYRCSIETYEWIVSFANNFLSDNNFIIVICDIDMEWESKVIKDIFLERFCELNINQFDDSDAYYQLIKEKIHFNNDKVLYDLSSYLYNEFRGDAKLILKLRDEVEANKGTSDEEKKKIILETCSNLISKNLLNLDILEKELLATLACIGTQVSLENISYILQHNNQQIKDALNQLIHKKLVIILCDVNTSKNYYKASDNFSKITLTNLVDSNMLTFINIKIFSLYKMKKVKLDDKQIIDIIIEYNPTGGSDFICNYLKKNEQNISSEYKASLINFLLENNSRNIIKWKNVETFDLLYNYGYYKNAKKFIESFEDVDKNYQLLMRYGNVCHLTLDKKTSTIFEKAFKIENISNSDYLRAVNRQLMAMTQQDKQSLLNAREIYKDILEKNSNQRCNGLVELYRNANNYFDYSKALTLTVRGYKLAKELDNKLETVKCLHNICMLELLNEQYELNTLPEGMEFKPTFEYVYDLLMTFESFQHETAYPLLNLAALQMFQFSEDEEQNHLIKAKSLYSEAQLYARSFYAKNIAEMGLLIVNSYIYNESSDIVLWRQLLFDRYKENRDSINDFRVHRKILFTLATSSKITHNISEGSEYLRLSKKYVFEKETLRYNNLCDELNIPSNEKIHIENLSNITKYHKTTKFVPWLISFGH